MNLSYKIVHFTFKRLVRILCRVDDSQWSNFPEQGPLILAANHINFMEIPVMYTHLTPRPVTGFVKSEGWDNAFTRTIWNLWGAIPLHRGEADIHALRAGIAALNEGKMLAMAPEGKRTGDGRLIQGHPGIVTLALKSKAPILPVVYYGNEHFWTNIKRLRRTDFFVKVGPSFTLNKHDAPVTKIVRRQMVDEIMFQLARLLPPENRGYYSDLSQATEYYLDFIGDEGQRTQQQGSNSVRA